MIQELGRKNRSYRRFYQDKTISTEVLKELIDVARNTPSGANRQPLLYKLVNEKEMNQKVFECLGWAGYYKDWDGPVEGERPSAYIIMVTPQNINPAWDEGIAGQTMLLAAVEKGMGGCFIGNIKKDQLHKILNLPQDLKVDLCIALGYPKENVVLEDIPADGDIKYYRDENGNQHVPKKRLDDIILD